MRLILIILTLFPFSTFGQYDPKMEEYRHQKIITKSDTIIYHVYSKGRIEEKNKILIYFHGSGGSPLFMQTIKTDT